MSVIKFARKSGKFFQRYEPNCGKLPDLTMLTNGLLHIAAQCWIVHETLKQGHTVQNHIATVSKNIP